LAQLEQAVLGNLLAHAMVHGQPNALIEIALNADELDAPYALGG
jgi:hypothetical protein